MEFAGEEEELLRDNEQSLRQLEVSLNNSGSLSANVAAKNCHIVSITSVVTLWKMLRAECQLRFFLAWFAHYYGFTVSALWQQRGGKGAFAHRKFLAVGKLLFKNLHLKMQNFAKSANTIGILSTCNFFVRNLQLFVRILLEICNFLSRLLLTQHIAVYYTAT